MGDRPEGTRFAIVVPESARTAAMRVPEEVRWKFGIDVWVVDELGSVALVQD
jgi:F420-0:gamma-glutamyl ligase-like protein